jgi:hypothetical protein
MNNEENEVEVFYNDATGKVVEREILDLEDGLRVYRLMDFPSDVLRSISRINVELEPTWRRKKRHGRKLLYRIMILMME